MTEKDKVVQLQHQMAEMAKLNNLRSDGNGGWIRQGEATQNTEIQTLKHRVETAEASKNMITRMFYGTVATLILSILTGGIWIGEIDGAVSANQSAVHRNTVDIKDALKYNAATFVTKDVFGERKEAVDIEVSDRKNYSDRLEEKVDALAIKLADDNLKIIEQINQHKH